jgi:hypothetical protein
MRLLQKAINEDSPISSFDDITRSPISPWSTSLPRTLYLSRVSIATDERGLGSSAVGVGASGGGCIQL